VSRFSYQNVAKTSLQPPAPSGVAAPKREVSPRIIIISLFQSVVLFGTGQYEEKKARIKVSLQPARCMPFFLLSLSLSRKEGGEMLLCDFRWLVGIVGWLAGGSGIVCGGSRRAIVLSTPLTMFPGGYLFVPMINRDKRSATLTASRP
jgi:hypothetical protein